MRLARTIPALAAAALLAGCSGSGQAAAPKAASRPGASPAPASAAVCTAFDADYRAYTARPGQGAARRFAGQIDRLARKLGYTDALLENYLRDAGKAMAAAPASRPAMAEVQRARYACLR
jgi:hypothetical protein